MKKLLLLLALTTALPIAALAQATDKEPEQISVIKSRPIGHQGAVTRSAGREGVTATLQYVQLPNMNHPRGRHQTFVDGEYLYVVGGYSTASKPTATAERLQYTDSDPYWRSYDIDNTHVQSFAVKRRLPDNSVGNPTSGYLIGGGSVQNEAGKPDWSSATSVVNYSVLGIFKSFSNGPKLYTPRIQAKGIYVNGKTYVSGNLNNDDSAMDVLEEGATEFKPVGQTSGHWNPYMFADSLGRVMVMSLYNSKGVPSEYYTDENGNKMLIGDLYDPLTNQSRRIGLRDFSPRCNPMMIPDDAKTEDYSVTYSDGSHRYFVLTGTSDGYSLYVVDMDDFSLGYFDDFDIPLMDKATGEYITWRGSVIANQNRKEVYLIGTSGPINNQTLHIISFSYRTLDWTIATASGFKFDMLTASWTLLNDGRLASTGGGVGNNVDALPMAYIFNPPLAGTTEVVEPENNGEGGESGEGGEGGLCVVVESTNGQKVRYLLEEDPRFYMKGETVTVTTSKVTIDYQTNDIARVYLENSGTTDVIELPALKEGNLSIEAGRIVITGLELGEMATVYQLSGTPVASAKADQEGRIVISIDGTPGKVSIIKTKHQSFKIIRK